MFVYYREKTNFKYGGGAGWTKINLKVLNDFNGNKTKCMHIMW